MGRTDVNNSANGAEITAHDGAIIVLCSCPNQEIAEQIASSLVEQHLAACVNIIPGVQSVYRWQGKIERDDELLLVSKTTASKFDQISTYIAELHPYELPEVIAVSIERGISEYLQWIEEQVK